MLRGPLRLISIALLLACGCDSGPKVDAWRNGAWQAVAASAFTVEGQRDGATTVASVRCTLADGVRLELKLELRYDPTPVLHGGSWLADGTAGGLVRAESVRFAGGQGEGPSVGGVFVLESEGEPRYRVSLPLRQVAATRWEPE